MATVGATQPLLRATQRRPRRGPSRARAAVRRLSDGALGEHYAVLTLGLAATVRQCGPTGKPLAGGAHWRAPERTRGRQGRAQGSAQTPPAQRVPVLTPPAQRVPVLTVDRCNALQRSPVQRRPGATALQRVSHSEAKPQAVPTVRQSRPTTHCHGRSCMPGMTDRHSVRILQHRTRIRNATLSARPNAVHSATAAAILSRGCRTDGAVCLFVCSALLGSVQTRGNAA